MSDWKRAIDSIGKLELLLFFHQNPSTLDSAASLAIWVGLERHEAELALAELARDGFVACSGDVYQYAPGPPQREHVLHAVEGYKTHRALLRSEVARARKESTALRETLQIERGRSEAVLDSISEGILLLSQEGELASLNPRARELLGEMPLAGAAAAAMAEACRAPGKPVEFSLAGKVLRLRSTALRHEPRQGFVLTVYDVTSEVEAERLKDDLARMITHDLKSPLSGILSLFDLLLRDSAMLDAKLRKIAEMGRKSTKSILDLVNHLLEIGALEDGHFGKSRTRVCLEEAIEAAVLPLGGLLVERGLKLERQYPAGSRTLVVGDLELLGRGIGNLISNAAKFSERGSSILIDCGRDDKEAFVNVRDQGEGIPEEELEQVFDRYYRVRKTSSAAVGGTGLGLYFVRLVAELHHGTVTAKNCRPRGCEFRISLPAV